MHRSFAIAFAAYIFTRVNKINFHFFRLHGATVCNVHSEVGYELVVFVAPTWQHVVVFLLRIFREIILVLVYCVV